MSLIPFSGVSLNETTMHPPGFTLFQEAALGKAKAIILIVGGVVVGSLLMGVGEAVSLLKKISRR